MDTSELPSMSSCAMRCIELSEKKLSCGAPSPLRTAVPATSILSSGEKSTAAIGEMHGRSPHSASGASNRRRSHTLSVPSVERLAKTLPSFRQRTHDTSEPDACAPRATVAGRSCSALNSLTGTPFGSSTTGLYSDVRNSHSCSEPSLAPHSSASPSGRHAAHVVPVLIPRPSLSTHTLFWPPCTLRLMSSRSMATSASHSRTVPSSEHVANVLCSCTCQRAHVHAATCPLVCRMSRMYGSPFISVHSLRPSRSRMTGWLLLPATISLSAAGL
mmetsp:Transcript_51660/g.118678  ORF Transcript_51660/g.118678 Transcript_51660/m.118678 type:complete len:273 (-) Transcript_51660:1449-2267(-)